MGTADVPTIREKPWALATEEAIRIDVHRPGWVEIPWDALRSADLLFDDPNRLRLFSRDGEIPMQLDATQGLAFLGLAADTTWSGTRSYWLTAVDPAGEGGMIPSKSRWGAPSDQPMIQDHR